MARILSSGNEAVAQAAMDAGVALGSGYPGTPSTEILEHFSRLGGKAQWSPNEKVALEVALGAAFAGARALVAMKHVGLNVAADPLFTAAYTGVTGALVVVSCDDPGMASSQNEQDNRRYAVAAGVPMLEPSDSQEAYDFALVAVEISQRWGLPVLLRLTTRVCHSKSILKRHGNVAPAPKADFVRDIPGRVMISAYVDVAHRKLRKKLDEIKAWNEGSLVNPVVEGEAASGDQGQCVGAVELGIIASGIAYVHAREAAPRAGFLKLGMTYPPPIKRIVDFARSKKRCLVIEEGDPYLVDSIRAAGIAVEGKSEMYRFGELNVNRVRRILAGDISPEPANPSGKPPQLCHDCPHRLVFQTLGKLGCIVAGDIGCYTLGALPPFEVIDSCVCMGASIGIGLGLRHVLPPEQARKVVSVIGDSTFVHSGITGLVEMIYNPPSTGHVVLILDNGTTAMTGLQEHPGTGRTLDHKSTGRVVFEDLTRALGVSNVHVIDPIKDPPGLERVLTEALSSGQLSVIVVRRLCVLAAKRIQALEAAEDESPRSQALVGNSQMSGVDRVTNIAIAGLGGQGVLTMSDILAQAAFACGWDVKKSDLHGMSQRGGSVTSDVRFGPVVYSPMVPAGQADYLVVLAEDQVEPNRHLLRDGGVLITPGAIDTSQLPNPCSLNIAMLGVLSSHLSIAPEHWPGAIRANLPEKLHAANEQAFELGRRSPACCRPTSP